MEMCDFLNPVIHSQMIARPINVGGLANFGECRITNPTFIGF